MRYFYKMSNRENSVDLEEEINGVKPPTNSDLTTLSYGAFRKRSLKTGTKLYYGKGNLSGTLLLIVKVIYASFNFSSSAPSFSSSLFAKSLVSTRINLGKLVDRFNTVLIFELKA